MSKVYGITAWRKDFGSLSQAIHAQHHSLRNGWGTADRDGTVVTVSALPGTYDEGRMILLGWRRVTI